MKGKNWIKVAILALIFFLAVIVSSAFVNFGNDARRVDLGDPVLPRISFSVEGREVNILAGYVSDMDLTSMRDTITPVPESGILQLEVNNSESMSGAIRYEVYSLDGAKRFDEGSIEVGENGKASLNLGKVIKKQTTDEEGKVTEELVTDEMVLKLVRDCEKGKETVPVSYYTRIICSDKLFMNECMTFVEKFHNDTFDKKKKDEIGALLELDGTGDNGTFQHVTIHSDAEHVTWGELKPEILGNVQWRIKETNPVYTSFQITYQVSAQGDSQDKEIFNIKEFYRVRYVNEEMYLLNYDRTMNQIFDGNKKIMNEDGILLGIVPPDISYRESDDGNIIAFVQERDLWVYNLKEKELSLVFSFANREGHDDRSLYDQHSVEIISLENNGSTVFAVYGYMNRGKHEGEVGAAIYYYDLENNVVDEKAFIPSSKSASIAEYELGKMVYYSHGRQMLYVIADGNLLEINLPKKKSTTLAQGLVSGQYVVSDDAHILAYQMTEETEPGTVINVMDLTTGEGHMINAPTGEKIKTLGFIGEDFVYGHQYLSDKSVTLTGDEIVPMYKISIVDNTGKVMKDYLAEGMYFSDVKIENSLMTIYRGIRSDGVYTPEDEDYISASEKQEDNGITLEKYTTDLQQRQLMITLPKDHTKDGLVILRPKQTEKDVYLPIKVTEKETENTYYVYGLGEQKGIFTSAGEAVRYADEIAGVVTDASQQYIWEKGNRNLVYYSEIEKFQKKENETSLQACERAVAGADSVRINLTGCTLDQLYYIISKGNPVIVMLDKDYAVLLTGYSLTDVQYIDPIQGERYTVSVHEMQDMIEEGGNTIVGYIK